MAETSRSSSRTVLQVLALFFLAAGVGTGCALGYQIGAVSDGVIADVTMIPRTADQPKAFNWLFFELGLLSGLICCAVLLAASYCTSD